MDGTAVCLPENPDPVKRLAYWISERESIRLQKDHGDPKPWTDDPILQSYRFCNVRRMDDKVSRWLLDNWYTPYRDHPNMVTAVTLARQLNNIPTLAAVGFPKTWNPQRVLSVLNHRTLIGLTNFSAAYMITGTLGGTKAEQVILKVVSPIHDDRPLINYSYMQKTWAEFLPYNGFSSFMAGQVVADLRWALSGTWADRNDWAPCGPGSLRGMHRLQGRPLGRVPGRPRRFDKSYAKVFLEELRGVVERCTQLLPTSITSRMEMMDWQNCCCEFDKYERARLGEGRPKQLYDGVGE